MKRASGEQLEEALSRWGTPPASATWVACSGSDVYRFEQDGASFALRLTPVSHRTTRQIEAELAFQAHLAYRGVPVVVPRRSAGGRFAEPIGEHCASIVDWAPGEVPALVAPDEDRDLYRAWGEAVGRFHSAAVGYEDPARWDWDGERWLAQADDFFPREDVEVRRVFQGVMSTLRDLPRTPDCYGMIHHDIGAQNLHRSDDGSMLLFDLGNCCRHWFVMDLVVTLSTWRRRPEFAAMRDLLLEGYQRHMKIDAVIWRHAPDLLHLRTLYVLLSRLDLFGPQPTVDQTQTLATLRELALRPPMLDFGEAHGTGSAARV